MLDIAMSLRLSHRISAVFLLPLTAFLILEVIWIVNDQENITTELGVQELTQAAAMALDMIHETQKERGQTAVYLSSNDAAKADAYRKLSAIRQGADEKAGILLTYLKDSPLKEHFPIFAEAVSKPMASIESTMAQCPSAMPSNFTPRNMPNY